MDNELEDLNARIDKLENCLGTLIAWLHAELGYHAAQKLLDMLKDEKQTPESGETGV